jgi:methyl-accepting chemotaxis protein
MAKSANILFQQQLSRLGPPSGASQQVSQQLRSYAGRLKSTNQSLQGLLSQPSSSASESAAKVQQARAMVQVMASQLQQAYKYMANLNIDPQLKQALKTNPTCRAVFGKA